MLFGFSFLVFAFPRARLACLLILHFFLELWWAGLGRSVCLFPPLRDDTFSPKPPFIERHVKQRHDLFLRSDPPSPITITMPILEWGNHEKKITRLHTTGVFL